MVGVEPRAGARWHAEPIGDVVRRLATDSIRGLGTIDAERRRRDDGPNELPHAPGVSALGLLARQFASVVLWVLIGAAGVSAGLGEILDATAILAIVVLNAVIGFVQEHRAERAVAALSRLTAPRARIVRDGVREAFGVELSWNAKKAPSRYLHARPGGTVVWN